MTTLAPGNSLTIAQVVERPSLRSYLKNVRDWHGYIRFLGLPDRRDNPDVLIDRLFVEPLLTRRYVSPDDDPDGWADEAETVFEVLKSSRCLLILGDPGTGKSTLVNYLVWLLARPTESTWGEQVGAWMLPVPMVLRELPLREVEDFRGLREAFLSHAMSQPLCKDDLLDQMLDEGRTLIILDGIDEMGDPEARRNLRSAVLDGLARYPRCRWLLSSRIVGYDEVRFDKNQDSHTTSVAQDIALSKKERHAGTAFPQAPSSNSAIAKSHRDQDFVVRYIAPFDDRRISEFSRRWYVQREAASTRAGKDAAHLVRAVHADKAILRLARIPNLLTMMALIHRIEATLPHGRALLYERIAEAYLESIDKYRGVYSGAYNLPQKRRWLARIGYEMQRRRSPSGKEQNGDDESQLLVDASDVVSWLNDEMQLGADAFEGMTAEQFLDFVGRRSGLFLPRGEKRYAFVHLSFQEYFAAVALEGEVTGIKWARDEKTLLGVRRSNIAEWASKSPWFETFSFLFELLASKRDWHTDLLNAAFGEGFSRLNIRKRGTEINLTKLLTRLVVNQRSGLRQEKRDKARDVVVRATLQEGERELRQITRATAYFHDAPGPFEELFGEDPTWNEKILRCIVEQADEISARVVSLARTKISTIDPLTDLKMLESLDLRETQVTDLAPIANLAALKWLNLQKTQVADLGPLSGLHALKSLTLWKTSVEDLSPLTELISLTRLVLWDTKVSDVRPLSGLTNLEWLDLDGTRIIDLEPLTKLTDLKTLYLRRTSVSDIGVLAKLTRLNNLYLLETAVEDLAPLANLDDLISLDLDSTQVTDLDPLAGLTSLISLDLRNTPISDLRPLSTLKSLRTLDLGDTAIKDLRPLSNLTALESLDLWNTRVRDLSPLASLSMLKSLDLDGTLVTDIDVLLGLTTLKSLDLRNVKISSSELEKLGVSLPGCNIVH